MDMIRRDAPFGGVRANHFHSLDAVGNAVLTVLIDLGVVAHLSHESCAGGLAQLMVSPTSPFVIHFFSKTSLATLMAVTALGQPQ